MMSASLHALALTAALADWRGAGGRAEVPAHIDMVFGSSVSQLGRAASRPAVAATPSASPLVPPSRDQGAGAERSAPSPRAGVSGSAGGRPGVDDPRTQDVDLRPDPANRPPMPPEEAFARGEHGRVLLRIHVRPDGLVARIETLQSSGFADLDRTAIDAVRRWHFVPQRRHGQAVASSTDQPIDFVLR